MKKRFFMYIFTIALISGLLLTSFSCKKAVPTPSPTPMAAAPAKPTPKPRVMKIGMILAMTGPGSFYGKWMSRGAMLAAEEINREGGVEGITFEIVIEDHKSGDPKAAVSGVKRLISIERVPVVLSSYSAPTLAILPIAAEARVLVFNGGGVSPKLIGKENLFNTRMLANQLIPFGVEFVWDKFGARKLATIFWNDPAGRGVNESGIEKWKELGGEVVAQEPHDIGQTDYSAELARIKAAKPDAILVGGWGKDVGYIIDQARKMGITVPMVLNDWHPEAKKIAGKNAKECYIAMDRFDVKAPHPLTQAFVKAYKEKYGEEPEMYAANYYEHVRFILPELIKYVVKQGGDPFDGYQLKDAIMKVKKFNSVYGGALELYSDGTCLKPASIFTVTEEGELKVIERIRVE